MATLLENSTFNGVCVGPGQFGGVTSTVVGCFAGTNFNPGQVENTIIGHYAGQLITDACGNSIMGARAVNGTFDQGTCFNVVIGSHAMNQGQVNGGLCFTTAIGYRSMATVGGGNHNTAIGHITMCQHNGAYNTFIGACAAVGNNNQGVYCNVGIGWRAMGCLGGTTSCNVAIGACALQSVNGNSNVAIGMKAGSGVVNASNTISAGYNSTTSDNDGHTAAGNSTFSCFRVGSSSWTNLSDRRDKSDIEELPNNLGLNFIRNLRPVKYNFDFRDKYVGQCGFEYGTKDGTLKQDFESYGFIAQEIETTINEVQTHFDALDKNEKGDYRLEYESLISPIVKSLQQTIERLEFLESKV
jgi:hypothetical protein